MLLRQMKNVVLIAIVLAVFNGCGAFMSGASGGLISFTMPPGKQSVIPTARVLVDQLFVGNLKEYQLEGKELRLSPGTYWVTIVNGPQVYLHEKVTVKSSESHELIVK